VEDSIVDASGGIRGSRTVKVLSWPGWLSTVIVPSWLSTICRVM
jgi:hypothetical protein